MIVDVRAAIDAVMSEIALALPIVYVNISTMQDSSPMLTVLRIQGTNPIATPTATAAL